MNPCAGDKNGLDELKKTKKNDIKALKKFSREEIEAYLATLNK